MKPLFHIILFSNECFVNVVLNKHSINILLFNRDSFLDHSGRSDEIILLDENCLFVKFSIDIIFIQSRQNLYVGPGTMRFHIVIFKLKTVLQLYARKVTFIALQKTSEFQTLFLI